MYHFDFTEQEVSILAEALGAMPYKMVAAIVVKMQHQINVAEKAKAVDPEPSA